MRTSQFRNCLKSPVFNALLRILMIVGMAFPPALGWVTPAQADVAGTALQFNGSNQYVTFGTAAGLTQLGVQTFTIETWFKRTGTGVTTTTGTGGLTAAIPLVTKGRGEGDNSNLDMNYFFGIETNVLAADFEECASSMTGCAAGGTAGLNHPVKGTTTISLNVWYHAAVTYDGRYWKLYLNGVQETVTGGDVGANRLPRWDSIQHAGIGTAMTSTGLAAGYFAGVIDEARIWNVVRTQAEIQASMNSELTSGTGLIGRWGMNEGVGTTIASSVSPAVSGTLTNGPAWVTGFPLPDTTPPAAPSSLTADPFNSGVSLTWTANSETDLAGYNLYRSGTQGGPYSKVNSSLIIATSYADGGLSNGTPYYYILRAVDNSTNESGNSNEAGTTPLLSLGAAVSFDGVNDYVTFGPNLNATNFTLEAWVKRAAGGATMTTGSLGLDGTDGRPNAYPVVTKGMGQGETPANINMNYFLGITSTGVVGADFEDNAGGVNHPAWGSTAVPFGGWHHIAATYNGSCWALYLDGNLESFASGVTACPNATPESTSIQHAGLAAGIGSTGQLSTGFFSGVIDEARIWNRALPLAEIQTNINSELTSGSGLIGRWGMNEGSGTSIASSVTPAVSGTLTNGPLWVSGSPFNISFTAPSAPSSLSAAAMAQHQINLTWTDNSTNEASFEIERGTFPVGPFSPLTSVGANVTAYADNSVSALTQYCYRVRAVNSGGASDFSDAACAVTPDQTPYALDFGSGQSYVTFGDANTLDLAQFTLEAWFRRDGTGTTSTTGSGGIPAAIPLISNGAPEADGSTVDMNYVLCIDSATNTLCADFEEGAGGASPGLNHPVYGITAITTGQWYHAAVTYDGTNWNLYLNGALERQLSVGQPVRSDNISPTALATMLESASLTHGFFNGALDEVRIWNYARNPAEIMSTINDQITTPQTGLVGRWSLNEGTGTTVNGSAGTSVSGTITGSGQSWISPGAPFNIVPPAPPAAPTLLSAIPTTGLEIDLTWTDNSNNETSFKIERSPDGTGGWTQIDTAVANATSYANLGLDPATQYCYRVRASNAAGDSDYSNISCSTTPGDPYNNGLDFGSSSAYAIFANSSSLNTPTFTIETWFHRDGAGISNTTGSNGTVVEPLIAKGAAEAETAAADINYILGINPTGNLLCADFEEAQTGSTPGSNHPVCGTTGIVNGTWYHAAATYDGATWRLYLNGQVEATQAVNQPANAANIAPFSLGTSIRTDSTTAQGFFNGVLDEVRVWNYARSQAEIQGTLNSPITSPQAGLVARWGLDEASGAAIASSAGTTIDGTISGSGYNWVAGAPPIANHTPALVSATPLDGAADLPLSTSLGVDVSDMDLDNLTVKFYGRPKPVDFSIVALPDTQLYSQNYPQIFTSQTNWIVNNTADNIVFVTHLGDIVNTGSDTSQWTNAVTALNALDTANIPYGLVVGNHDQNPYATPGSTAEFNANFGISRFDGRAYYGGHYGTTNDNNYELFSAGGMDFIIIHMEYNPTPPTALLDWANNLLQTNSSRRAIVVTHNLLNGNNFSGQGTAIFNALKGNSNLFLMLGGHEDTAGRRQDTGTNGNVIYSLRSDYQNSNGGQSGYLRIMTFKPLSNQIEVKTYSPYRNDSLTDTANQFTLNYTMPAAGFQQIGVDQTVLSGSGTAAVNWTGLSYATEYEWYATISDGIRTTTVSRGLKTVNAPTAMTLTRFKAQRQAGPRVQIGWTTVSDLGTIGFNLYRSQQPGGPYTRLNRELIPVKAPTFPGSDYAYVDPDAPGRVYYYRLERIGSGLTPFDYGTLFFNDHAVFIPFAVRP